MCPVEKTSKPPRPLNRKKLLDSVYDSAFSRYGSVGGCGEDEEMSRSPTSAY